MLGDGTTLPDALLAPLSLPEPAPADPGLLFGLSPQIVALEPFDQWGAVQFPTTTALPFVPVATSLWVAPASIPASDPCLAVILDWLATWLVTDRMVTAAWSAVSGAAGTAAVRRVFPHDPGEVVFSTSHLPALYLWRDSAKQEWAADDWLRETTVVKGLWVFPLAQQANQRARQPGVNALAKAVGVGIERGRTVSWVQPGDLDPDAQTQGSLFYIYAGFEAFELSSWKTSKLIVPAADGSAKDEYPAIELTFTMQEKLDYGLARFGVVTGAFDTITNPQGEVVVSGPLNN